MNKTQASTGEYCGIHDLVSKTQKTSQYAWNSTLINDNHVLRSLAAVGRKLKFHMDTELLPTPTLNADKNQLLFKCLQDVSINSQFEISVLKF